MSVTYDPGTIAIGVLGKPHGVNGEIALRLFNVQGPALGDLSSVILERAGQRTTRVVTRARPAPKGLLITFEGVSSREQAAALTLSEVRVNRSALPAPGPGEYFVSDVIGCEVFDEDGVRLGVVGETFWNGAHDIMVVRGAGQGAGGSAGEGQGEAAAAAEHEHLIPLVPDFIREVDVAGRTIRVAWHAA